MTIELRKLSAEDGVDIYEMLQEIPADENGYVNGVHGMNCEEYREWLAREEENAKKTELEDGWKVPQTTYWLHADGRPVGQGKIRHFLTDALRQAGGNIGYTIRPSERGKGYGAELLRLLRREAAQMGMDRALVTVHNGNTASIRTALRNGGVIERIDEVRHFIWVPCGTVRCAVRPAAQSDVTAISCVYSAAWKAAYCGIVPDDFLDSLTMETCAPGTINPDDTMVCETEKGIIGVVSFGRRRDGGDDGCGEIYSLYVMPEHWRTGAGSALLRAAAAKMRVQGYTSVFLWTLTENLRAIAFYERTGMQKCAARMINIGGRELAETGFQAEINR